MALQVVIAGLPSSGNRLVRTLIQSDPSVGRVLIVHFGNRMQLRRLSKSPGDPIRAIVVLREPIYNLVSQRKRSRGELMGGWTDYAAQNAAHWRPTLDMLAGITILPVRYEDIVADPEEWGSRIMRFLGLRWQGWPVNVVDANQAHEAEVAELRAEIRESRRATG